MSQSPENATLRTSRPLSSIEEADEQSSSDTESDPLVPRRARRRHPPLTLLTKQPSSGNITIMLDPKETTPSSDTRSAGTLTPTASMYSSGTRSPQYWSATTPTQSDRNSQTTSPTTRRPPGATRSATTRTHPPWEDPSADDERARLLRRLTRNPVLPGIGSVEAEIGRSHDPDTDFEEDRDGEESGVAEEDFEGYESDITGIDDESDESSKANHPAVKLTKIAAAGWLGKTA